MFEPWSKLCLLKFVFAVIFYQKKKIQKKIGSVHYWYKIGHTKPFLVTGNIIVILDFYYSKYNIIPLVKFNRPDINLSKVSQLK